MKNIIRVLILVVLSVGLYLVVDLIITKGDSKIAIPELTSSSTEFGTLTKVDLNESNYEIHKQTLSSFDFIDKEINAIIEGDIDRLTKESESKGTIPETDKAAYADAIDTIKVNDNLVSVRVTSMTKKVGEAEFSKQVELMNFDLSSKKKISLDDLFTKGYKDVVSDVYTDDYLLVHNGIEFFGKDTSVVCPYNKLKDHLKNQLLTSADLQISQKEYTDLTAKKTAKATETSTEKSTEKNKKTEATEESTTEASKSTETATANTESDGKDKDKDKEKEKKKKGDKVIAFTFDDGPHKTNTDKILDLLAQYGCHATFFMQGINASYYPDVVKRVYESGNELGNHTWDHKNLKNLSESEISAEVNDAADEIESITGSRPKVVRPPYGGFNDTVKAVVEEPLIRWSVDSMDWDSRDPDQIVPLVLENVEDGDIILFHDVHETTTPAIERLLPALIDEGYTIVSVSELMEAKGYDINSQDLWYSAK